MTNIKVIDSAMGTGKTSLIIDYINKAPKTTKFLVITPLLSEITRFKESCPERNFIEPSYISGSKTKMSHLIKLILEGKNICSTHALLQKINDELVTALKNSNYVLILDESFQVINNFVLYDSKEIPDDDERAELTKQDIEWLLRENYIRVNEDYLVSWVDDTRPFGNKYQNLYTMIKRELLYMIRNRLFIWTFPYELFSKDIFEEVYILTYLFKAQFQHYYFEYFNVQYETFHVVGSFGKYKLVKTENQNHDVEFRQTVSKLLTILDNSKMNNIGDVITDIYGRRKATSLSLNWFRKNPLIINVLKKNLVNFYKHIHKVPAEKRMWTSFKEQKRKLQSSFASSKNFLSFTTKATNQYRNKTALAFVINRYPNRFYVEFFRQKNIQINDDLYALSDLLQWIWRSAIRDNLPVTLYLPSERMRTILQKYLNNEPFDTVTFEESDWEEQ